MVKTLEANGKLHPFLPRTRKPPRRRLYLTERAHHEIANPNSAMNVLKLRGHIEAALTRWTAGDRIHADDKGKARFLKRLDPPPPEIWEIRVVDPNPQVRIFGRFAGPDTLIVTSMHTRSYLGKQGSAAWLEALSTCEKTWKSLFPVPPFEAPLVGDYVTENCDEYRI